MSRDREIDHDSNLYATYRQEEARLRDEHDGLEIRRVVLEQDLKRDYHGVRAKRGDFEPLISEDLFSRVQAVLSGRAAQHDAAAACAPGLPTPRVRTLRVLWSRSHRQLVEGQQRSQPKWRFAKARPEPDFR